MDFNTMHKQRKFILIAAALGIISMFLPWYKIEFLGAGTSVNGMHSNGIIIFIAFAVCGVMAFLGDQKVNVSKNAWLIILGSGALALLLCIINIFNKGGAGGGLGSDLVKIGIGLIIATISCAGILFSAYTYRSATDNLKQSLNEMKKNIENKVDNNPNT